VYTTAELVSNTVLYPSVQKVKNCKSQQFSCIQWHWDDI